MSSAGETVYINREISPVALDKRSVNAAIDDLSRRLGQSPQIRRLRLPDRVVSIIAVWGGISLVRLSDADTRTLASNGRVARGYLVDFLGHFSESARRNYPVYQLRGGAGFVVRALRSPDGKGELRMLAAHPALYDLVAASDEGPLHGLTPSDQAKKAQPHAQDVVKPTASVAPIKTAEDIEREQEAERQNAVRRRVKANFAAEEEREREQERARVKEQFAREQQQRQAREAKERAAREDAEVDRVLKMHAANGMPWSYIQGEGDAERRWKYFVIWVGKASDLLKEMNDNPYARRKVENRIAYKRLAVSAFECQMG